MYSRWISLILIAGVLCARVSSTPTSHQHRRELPCNHRLRIVVPSLFSHCETSCTYSDWSEWTKIRIPTNKCNDTKYYNVFERTRDVLVVLGNSADCTEVKQQKNKTCFPPNHIVLIKTLGLGVSAHNGFDSFTNDNQNLVNTNSTSNKIRKRQSGHPKFVRQTADVYGNGTRCPNKQLGAGRVCQHLTGRRSTGKYLSHKAHKTRDSERHDSNRLNINILDSESIPIPFDWNIHGSQFRQRRQAGCSEEDTQYILFVLDSSGSIGQNNFEDMRTAVATLTALFCRKIKTALISFSSYIKLEYCFDCFEDTIPGREKAQQTILNTTYIAQNTYTGATANCICNDILKSSCGINTTDLGCLDVIFITDGYSNDPNLKVCEEIKCLHNQMGITTRAIGIGGYNPTELKCIANNSDDLETIEYETFQDFMKSVNTVLQLMIENPINERNLTSCSASDGSLDYSR